MPPKKQKKVVLDENLEDIKQSTNKKQSKEEQKIDIFSEQQSLQISIGDGKFSNSIVNISSWNINGIRAVIKKGELIKYMNDHSPDILCLNEIKIDESAFIKEKIQDQFPNNYQYYWNFCKPPNKGYAGTAMFSKVLPISVQFDLGIEEHDDEGRTITLEFDKFYLVVCYVPNAGQGLPRLDYRVKKWDIDFQTFLNNLKKKKTTILCGDLNVAHNEIDLANPKGNQKSAGFTKEERQGFTNYLSQGWVDTFRKLYPDTVKYSYWNQRNNSRSTNQGWRLDYYVIDDKSFVAVKDSLINNDVYGSDHCPVELQLDLNKI